MNRFSTYLRCAKISRDFIFVAGEQAKRGDTQKALQSLIAGMSAMLTAMNNAASIGFDKKPKAAPRQKKVLSGGFIAMLALMVLAGSGCTQWKKLTGADPKKDCDPANVNGVWGGTMQLDGQPAHAEFIMVQNGTTIVPEGFFSINYSQYGYIHLNGSVSGNTFTAHGIEGTQCPNEWTFSGEVNGGTMVVTIQTQGNNVPGTYCYPRPVNQTIAMSH